MEDIKEFIIIDKNFIGDKKKVLFKLNLLLFIDESFYTYSPSLNILSYGLLFKDSLVRFEEMSSLYLEDIEGEISGEQFLINTGWRIDEAFQKITKWIFPNDSINKDNYVLQSIRKKKIKVTEIAHEFTITL